MASPSSGRENTAVIEGDDCRLRKRTIYLPSHRVDLRDRRVQIRRHATVEHLPQRSRRLHARTPRCLCVLAALLVRGV